MTPKQARCLQFIASYTAQHGEPPTYEEMKKAMDMRSKSGVERLIRALETQGHLQRHPRKFRSIVLAESRANLLRQKHEIELKLRMMDIKETPKWGSAA